MIDSRHNYEDIYRQKSWAYSDKPDPELIRSLVDLPRGKAVDVGGGQGRHSLALSALGFEVLLVDAAQSGLHQASGAAAERGLNLHVLNTDVGRWEPEDKVKLAVAALFFHIPARKTSLKIAERIGGALESGGLLYFSFPGFDKQTQEFAGELIQASGCAKEWIVKHLVTKKERPRLKVSRRNETRVLAKR